MKSSEFCLELGWTFKTKLEQDFTREFEGGKTFIPGLKAFILIYTTSKSGFWVNSTFD